MWVTLVLTLGFYIAYMLHLRHTQFSTIGWHMITTATFLGITFSYIIIYLIIRSFYEKQINLYETLLSRKDITTIRAALKKTMIFFFAIVQYLVVWFLNIEFRNRASLNKIVVARTILMCIFIVSEIVLMISLCNSLNQALKQLKD